MKILQARLIKVTHILASVVIFGDLCRFGPSLAFYGTNNSDGKGRWQRRPKTADSPKPKTNACKMLKTLRRSNWPAYQAWAFP